MGSPVKVSMTAKVVSQDRDMAACIYIPRTAVAADEAQRWATDLSNGFRNWCAAVQCNVALVPEAW